MFFYFLKPICQQKKFQINFHKEIILNLLSLLLLLMDGYLVIHITENLFFFVSFLTKKSEYRLSDFNFWNKNEINIHICLNYEQCGKYIYDFSFFLQSNLSSGNENRCSKFDAKQKLFTCIILSKLMWKIMWNLFFCMWFTNTENLLVDKGRLLSRNSLQLFYQ